MTTYPVTATREGRWWAIEVPGHPIATQAAKATDIAAMATEAIALTYDVDEAEVDVDVVLVVPDAQDALTELAAARDQADTAARASAAAAARAARRLRAAGLSTRESARVLGLSHQRVHQLLTDA